MINIENIIIYKNELSKKIYVEKLDNFIKRIGQDCWINDKYLDDDIIEYLNYIQNLIDREIKVISSKVNIKDDINNQSYYEEIKDYIRNMENNLKYLKENKDDIIKKIKKHIDREDEIMRACI